MPQDTANDALASFPDALRSSYVNPRVIGQGGMGIVYQAEAASGDSVAIKVIEPRHLQTPEARRAFIREARATLRLRHPNVVSLLDFDAPAREPAWLVTEYMAGGHFGQLAEAWPGWTGFLAALDDVLSALAFAHARGVVHCDIKPENILLDDAGTAKLTDFGVAHLAAHSVGETVHHAWRTEELSGTPTYMSPEQAEGNLGAYGPWTDFYALGVVIYEALAGRPPFDADSVTAVLLKHMQDPVPPLILRPEIRELQALTPLLIQMLAKDPWDRPRFAAHIRASIRGMRDEAARLDGAASTQPMPAIRGERPVTGPDAQARVQTLEDVQPLSAKVDTGSAIASLQSLRTQELAIVGREHERALLVEAAQAVLDHRRPRVVLIEGKAGMGKSRLAEALREHLEERGDMQSWTGSYRVEAGALTPGLRGAVEAYYLCLGLDRPQVREAVGSRLARLGGSDPWEQQALLSWFRPEPWQPSLPDATVVGLALRAIGRAAARHPLLVWLDDAHYALEGQVLPLVDRLFEEDPSNALPVLVVVTYRPITPNMDPRSTLRDRLDRLTQNEQVTALALGPMTDASLIQLLVDDIGLTASAAERILAQTGGRPLLALQAARAAVELSQLRGAEMDSGDLAVATDSFGLGSGKPVIVSPLSSGRLLDGALRDALDSLPNPDGVRVLGMVALLGPRTTAQATAMALEHAWRAGDWRPRAESVLERAASMGLLRWQADEDLVELAHVPLTRRLVAELQRRGDATAAHEAAADTLGALFGDQQGTALAERARHLARAQRAGDAWALMMRAVDEAVNHARYPEASVYATEMQSWFAEWAEPAESERRGRLARALTRAAMRCGAVHEAERHLKHELLRPTELPTVLAERALLQGEVEAGRGNTTHAVRAFEAARAAYTELDDRAGLATAELGLATMQRTAGELEAARASAARALEAFASMDDALGRARSLRTLGQIELMDGALDAAEAAYTGAVDLFTSLGDLHGTADARRGLGGLALERGDADRALSTLREAYKVYRTIGDLHGAAHALRGTARARRMKAQPDFAAAELGEAIELFDRLGGSAGAADCLLDLASLERENGEFDAAMKHLETALNAYREAGDDRGVASCETTLGNVLVDAGKPSMAIEYHKRAMQRFERRGHTTGMRVARLNLGNACLLAERLPEAVDVLQSVESEATARGDLLLSTTASVYLAISRVRADDLEGGVAWMQQASEADDLTVSVELATSFERLADDIIGRYGAVPAAIRALQQSERQYRFLGRRSEMRRVSKRRVDLQAVIDTHNA